MTERYIRNLVSCGAILSRTELSEKKTAKFIIPITELTESEQLRYYRSIGAEAPEELTPKKRSEPRKHKTMEEFSALEREEIADWIRIIREWEEYCAKSKLQKVAATDKFVQLQQTVNPNIKISKGILYRKKRL